MPFTNKFTFSLAFAISLLIVLFTSCNEEKSRVSNEAIYVEVLEPVFLEDIESVLTAYCK